MAEQKDAEELPLGSKDYQDYEALANEKLILQVARILKTIGDFHIEVDREIRIDDKRQLTQRQLSLKEYFSSALKNVFHTVDVVLQWLEYSGKNAAQDVELKKKEGVLRGLYHITALGSQASFLGLLELACKFLDVPENPYQAKREHISVCLAEVDDQKQQLFQLVTKAGEILESILQEPEFNYNKGIEFDNIVRQANDVIESCKGLLATAEETIKELTRYMNIMKWFSRGLRLTGWGITCYGLYNCTPSSSSLDALASYFTPNQLDLIQKICFDSKLNVVFLASACAASGYMWLSLFPSRAYAFHDSLAGLEYEHLRLTKGLQALERRLKTAVDVMDGLRASKTKCKNPNQEAEHR